MTQKVSKSSIKVSLFKLRRLVVALVFLFAAQGVWGETYYWVGGTSGNWELADNWATSLNGSGGAGIPGTDATDIVNLPSVVEITLANNVTIDKLFIPNPNDQTNSFTVTITGDYLLTVSTSIETFRPTSDTGNNTSLLVFNCNVSSPNVTMHSGANITIAEGRTANLTAIQHVGGNSPPTLLTVNGDLISTSIEMSTINDQQEILVGATGSISSGSITGSEGSITNNGFIVTQTPIGDDVINNSGSGTSVAAAAGSSVWTGMESTVINNPNNWFGENVPDGSNQIVIPVVERFPEVATAISLNPSLLTIEDGAYITVNATLTLTSDFDIASKIDTASTGKLVINGKLSNNSSTSSVPFLNLECTTLEVSKDIECKSLVVSGTSSLSCAAQTWLVASGTGADDGITFGGNVDVTVTGGQFLLGGKIKGTANINIQRGTLNHIKETRNNNCSWASTVIPVLTATGCTFGMAEGISYTPKITAATGDVFFVGNGTLDSITDTGAGCNIHFGNTDNTQSNSFSFGNDIAFNTTGNIIFDKSCSGLTGLVTLSGIKTLDNKSEQLTSQLGVNISLESGATITGNDLIFNDITFAGSATVESNIENKGALSAGGTITFEKDYKNSGTAGFTSGLSVAKNLTDSGTSFTGAITFNGSASDQTFTTKAGTTYTSVEVTNTANTFILVGNLTTSGAQTYNGKIKINDDYTLSAFGISFNDDVTGTGKLTVASAATLADGKKIVPDVVISATTGSITCSGKATFEGTVTNNGALTGDSSVNKKELIFEKDYSGAGNLTASKGTTTFKADAAIANSKLSANGGTIILTAANTTGGAAAQLSGNNTFNNLTFQSSVSIIGSNTIETLTASNLGGKTITFGADTTQTVTNLNLSGTATPSEENPYNSLALTSNGTWNIICPGTALASHTIQYLSVKNSNSTNVLKVTNCTDATGNSNWIFVGQKYTWKGGSGSSDAEKKKWDSTANWEPASIPCIGSTVVIPEGKDFYPILPSGGIDIADTDNGTITIASGASLDFNGQPLTVKSISNAGTVYLKGTESITGTMENGNNSTVEYYGTADPFNFVWDGSSDAGKQYTKLIINRPVTQSTDNGNQIIVSGTTTIAAASGTVDLSNENNSLGTSVKVGTSDTSAANVTLKAESLITLDNNAYASALTIESPVKLQNVTTTGNQTYNSTVAINNTGTTTLQAGGTITFGGNVSGQTGGGRTNSLSVQATSININCSSITTARAQTYTGAVTLGATTSVALTSNSRDITFGSTTVPGSINGNKSLILSVPETRAITFYGDIGATDGQELASLSLTGTTNINCASITTTGDQTYSGAVNLKDGGATTITGADITFGNTVNGKNTLTVTSSGDGKSLTFNGNVGATTGKELASLEVTGTTNINCASITTTGDQTYEGAVNLKDDGTTALSGADITFGNTVNGKNALTITSNGDGKSLTFKGNVGATTGKELISLTVNGNSKTGDTSAISIITTGNQTYNGTVTLNNSTEYTASQIIVTGDISGASKDLTLTSPDIQLAGDVSVNNLSIENTTSSDYTVTFNGSNQEVAVSSKLTLKGNKTLDDAKHYVKIISSNIWQLSCDSYDISYVDVIKSNNISNLIIAENSVDSGNNTNWAFPGQEYEWTGTASTGSQTSWNNAGNWSPVSVPGIGSIVTIPADKTNYPVITGDISLDQGSYLGSITNNGTITFAGGSLTATTKSNGTNTTNKIIYDYSGTCSTNWIDEYKNLEVTSGTILELSADTTVNVLLTNNGTITNNANLSVNKLDSNGIISGTGNQSYTGAVTLSGATTLESTDPTGSISFSAASSITGNQTLTITAGNINSTNGGTLATNGNLVIGTSGETINVSIPVVAEKNLTNNANVTFGENVSVAGDVTDNGTWDSADGKQLIFNGSGAQKFIPVATTAYKSILIDKSAGSFATETNALDVTTFADSNTNASSITFATNTTIKNAVVFNTSKDVSFAGTTTVIGDTSVPAYSDLTHAKGITNLKGTITAANITLHKANLTDTTELIAHGDVAFVNIGTSSYANVYGAKDLTITVDDGKSVTFNGDVGKAGKPIPKSLTINGKTNIKCTLIATSGNQIYNGDIDVYSNSSSSEVQLTTDSTHEVDFSGNIVQSATGKKLIINTPVFKSTKTTEAATVSVSTIELARNVTLNSASGGGINLSAGSVSQTSGSSFTLTNMADLALTSTPITISPAFENDTSGSLTASSGTTIFKADVNLSNGTFAANNGTVVLTGTTTTGTSQTLTTKSDGSTSFNNLKIQGNVTINNSNTIATLTAADTEGDTSYTLGGKTITFGADTTQTVTSMTLKGRGTETNLLTLTSSGNWNINCVNEPVLDYLSVHNSTNNTSGTPEPGTNFVAYHSTDAGGNTYWAFPDMTYTWLGTTSTAWNETANWQNGVVPTKGASVVIAHADTNKYPELTGELNLNTSYGGNAVNGLITVNENATFDLADQDLTVGTITNNGLVRLIGVVDQTINGTMINGDNSTVEYYGTGATTTNFAWDGEGTTVTTGKQYANLILNQNTSSSETLTVSKNLTINNPANLLGVVSVTGTTTIAAGTGNAVTLNNASNIFKGNVIVGNDDTTNPVNAGAVTLNGIGKDAGNNDVAIFIQDNVLADSLILNSNIRGSSLSINADVEVVGNIEFAATTLTFSKPVTGTSFKVNGATVINTTSITTSGNQTYNGTVSLKQDGNITLTAKNASDELQTVYFKGSVSCSDTNTKNLIVDAITDFNCESITTTGTQTYNGTVTLKSDSQLFASQINFEADITDNAVDGSRKKLTIAASTLQSTTSSGNSIIMGELAFTGNTSIKTNSKVLTLAVPRILGTGKTITLTESGSTLLFTGDEITVSPKVQTESGTTFTASSGTMIFNSDVTLADGTLAANGGIIIVKAGTLSGANTFNTLTVQGPVTISGANTITDLNIQDSVTISANNTITNLTANKTGGLGGKTITFGAGTEQTVSGLLTLKGSANTDGNRLNLRSSAPTTESATGTQWKIKCTGANAHDIQFVDVQDSNNESETGTPAATAYYLFALNSIDHGHNTKWNFPGMKYVWTGADSTDPTNWNVAANWEYLSIPGKGADVEIPAGCTNYPELIEDLDLYEEYQSNHYYGKITIKSKETGKVEGKFDLAGFDLKLGDDGEITNRGLVRLIGAAGQTINGKMINVASSTVEYYGTGATPTNFAWDGDGTTNGTSSDGKQYANLILNQNTSGSTVLVMSENLTINNPADLSGAVTVGGNLTIAEETTLSGLVSVTGTTTIAAGSGKNVSLNNESNSFKGSVIVGNDDATSSVNAGAVTLNGIGKDTNNNDVAIFIQDNVLADSLTLNSNVRGSTLSINADVVVDDNIEFTATTLTFKKPVTGRSFKINGDTVINTATINTSGNQTYNGNVNVAFANESTLETSAGDISFTNANANVYGNKLTLKAPAKTISFNGTAGTQANPLTELKITSASATVFEKAVYITSFSETVDPGTLTFKNGGKIVNPTVLNTTGNVTLTGELETQSLQMNNLIIDGTAKIKTSGAQTYNGSINGKTASNDVLNLDSGAGHITFNGDIGQSLPPQTLNVTGQTTINCEAITTSGTQTYNSAITLGTSPSPETHTLTASGISFVSKIDGGADLALVTNSGTSFAANIGDTNPPTSLTVTGLATIGCTAITTSGNQHYKNAVTLTASPTLTSIGGNLTFDSTIDGEQLLTLSVPQNTTTPAATYSITVAGKVGETNIPSLTIAQAGNASFGETVKTTNFIITKANDSTFAKQVDSSTFVITQSDNTLFNKAVNVTNFTISTATTTTFDEVVQISTFTDAATAGDISFKNGGTIATATEFKTSGTITLGDAASDIMTFGTAAPFVNITHTAGDTSITGTLNAAAITLAQTSGGPMTILNTGLLKTLDGEALTYTTSFTQNGAGNSILGGSFSGNGNASFATDLQLYGSSQADFGAAGTNISIAKNLIIIRAATDDLNIKSNVNVAENLVLYKGPVVAEADIAAGKDILVLGSAYSEKDTTTGIADEYSYYCLRPETWSQVNYTATTLPDGTATPGGPSTGSGTAGSGAGTTVYSSSLAVSSGKTISTAKNFYANGTTLSLNGTSGQWTLKVPDLTNAANAFAESYHSKIAGCKVICSDNSDDGSKARLVCLECDDTGTNSAPNTNVDFDDFEITAAWTERDNSIRVEFNRPVRYYDATVQTLKFQNPDGAPNLDFTGLYSDPDCQTEIKYDTEMSYFYIKAAPQNDSQYGAWNTDATGRSSDADDNQSTDRSGIHHENIPALDFARALVNGTGNGTTQAFIFTDRWGKRLNNYSSRTPTAQAAYGSTDDAEATHEVADKTGPVLYSVRTGQELHDAYNPSTGQASEHSYDSHNFIEFVYSEKVDFDSSSDDSTLNDNPATAENVQVNDSLGAVKGDVTKADNLELAGLGILQNGLLYTGSNGSANKYVSALYRKGTNAAYAIRLSIAGYTDPSVTLSDDDGYTYKKWIGYIEQASLPSGTVKHLVDSNNKNERVKDKDGNVQIKYANDKTSGEPVFDTIPVINSTGDGLYGDWDLSEPVFALYRQNAAKTLWTQSEFDKNYYAEAIGNNSGVGSTLDRIEFHLYDNTPDFESSEALPEWFTEVGWCNPGSIGEKPNDLYKTYSYAADIFGGSRAFDSNASIRTSGGIRYSTVYSSVNAFKYAVGSALQERLITTSFDTSKIGIPGATSLIFTGTSSPRRSAGDSEGLYFALPLANTSLDIKTSFTVKYDDTLGFITDLAGNRLRTKIFSTIDRTPPSIDMTVCPVGGDEMEIIFVKELCTQSDDLEYNDNSTGEKVTITEEFDSLITNCFDFITIDSSGTHHEATDLSVDHSVPAKITIKTNQNGSSFTIIHLKLSRTVTLDDIKNKFIRVVYVQKYGEYSVDLFTGHPGSRVTFIQDENGNNIQMYTAHAISDFAVGIINPLYAYDSAMTEDDGTIISDSLFRQNLTEDVDTAGWSVHNWNRDQQNYGTLPAKRPLALVADTFDGTEENADAPDSFRIYLSNNPDSGSVSTQYNKDLEPLTQWRIWLPNQMDGVFTSLSEKNNKNYSQVDGTLLTEDKANRMIFDVGETITNLWSAGNQISFLFGLTNSDGSPVTIMHSPEIDINKDKQYLATSTKMPLFALRQTDPTDLLSLDLWSFRLKNVVSQRGGVTILNNAINSSKHEKVVVKVNQPEQGNLTVVVMTLDGNIVDYLHRGSSSAGEHFYSWDGTNRKGKSVARGMYFIRVTGPGLDETRKVLVVKD